MHVIRTLFFVSANSCSISRIDCYGVGTEALVSASYRDWKPNLAAPEKRLRKETTIRPKHVIFCISICNQNKRPCQNFYRAKSWKFEYCTLGFTSLVTQTPKHLDGGQEQRQIKLSIARKINSGTRLEMIVGTKPRPNNLKRKLSQQANGIKIVLQVTPGIPGIWRICFGSRG